MCSAHRTALAPVAQDIVLTGHNTESIGMLIFPNIAACRQLCPDLHPTCEVAQVLSCCRISRRNRPCGNGGQGGN